MSNIQIKNKNKCNLEFDKQVQYLPYEPYRILCINKEKGSGIGIDISVNRGSFGVIIKGIDNNILKKYLQIGDKILFVNNLQIADFTKTEVKQLLLNKSKLELLIKSSS
jgi:hypothetical protein